MMGIPGEAILPQYPIACREHSPFLAPIIFATPVMLQVLVVLMGVLMGVLGTTNHGEVTSQNVVDAITTKHITMIPFLIILKPGVKVRI